ncbi:cytochrome c class I [Chloroherpeton thalassium ATCC 35110]|uniref:Cytochrome c class I n=1 Tax=Chloroherpeton thalassium (strain ATCC 35110 / GB-78) TaxID=517418 RepID=B3QU82_CHLT3|nr:photosystem P840 reaction-center cytochrome c-551 [Chloroherpeton thalassium]ACF14331.1 cytochrome c class I [Chloroherpeton thalassium ATCC 35110]
MDNSKFQLIGVAVGGAIFFLVLFYLVSLATGYQPYADGVSSFAVLKTVFGWLALFLVASFVTMIMGRMSQLITSGWFIGILVGAVIIVGLSATFLFSTAGPRTTTLDGQAIRSVAELEEFNTGGVKKKEVTGEAAAFKETFEKRCNKCHTMKSVESTLVTKYVSKNEIGKAVNMMASFPNSGILPEDVPNITAYLNALYGVDGKSAAPAKEEPAAAPASGADAAAPAKEEAASFDATAIKAELKNYDTIAGEDLYNASCAMCHSTGISGAPKVGTAGDWSNRMPQGVKEMAKKSIDGFNSMPARGGNPSLSDEQVSNAVAFMVDASL